ncbi:GIY-YIG nuclease family protein [Andreprevotia chitinilytica]|uniref:GIY-YIG nuclease family protein n=1 Tax=Andreprevotia chitinilytica TaxID=396808 RepID=UPI00054FFA54|nr:GIY-YIG nuclease family protein [Andreprevotia chitinilytica]
MKEQKPWFVYLIECVDGSVYTGVAIDVAKRYAVHVSGKGARYTRSRPPLRLLAVIEFPNRSEALKAEYDIKQLPTPKKWAFIRSAGGPISID